MKDMHEETKGRKGRADSLRAAEARYEEIKSKADFVMDYRSPLDIPEHLIPEGWRYDWIRTVVPDTKAPDDARQYRIASCGYTPVPKSRHANLCLGGFLGEKAAGDFITYKDLLLCEVPLKLYKELVANTRKQYEATVAAIARKQFEETGRRGGFVTSGPLSTTTYSNDLYNERGIKGVQPMNPNYFPS